MALAKSRSRDVPEDAIILTEDEAVKHQMDLVKQWDKINEVFALRYGPYILGGAALISGAFFNNHFRKKFMLRNLGHLSTYLPICFVPGFSAILLHSELVLKKVVLLNFDTCPLCLQTRAAALQATLGVVFPAILAPIGCASLALRYGTYNIPYFQKAPREAFEIVRKMYTKIHTKSMYLFIGQAFLASVVTYFEASNIINISKRFED
ncbi:hypothetical protein ABEB36_012481 [Hypothenemus hampei]|uniref:Transmembrane protein 126A n=1 Tax=Hypothenemus hampei TaxID=57062 RepID=A0ABD1EBI4_HYPHA